MNALIEDPELDPVPDAVPGLPADQPKPEFSIRTPDEILGMVFDDSDIILGDRVLAESQPCVIAGAGGCGKSRFVIQMAACVTTGRDFIGMPTSHADLTWLIIGTENSNRRLQADLRAIKALLGGDWAQFAGRVKFHTIETDADAFVNLDSAAAAANIQSVIESHNPDIIVIDPLNDFAIGDPNKDADMKLTLQNLSRICRKGNPKRAIIVLHHALTGKAGAAKATGFDRSSFGRNSKALFAWTRAQINLAPYNEDNNDCLIVACGKLSNGREFKPFAIRLNHGTMIYELAPEVDISEWVTEVTGRRKNDPLMTPERVRDLCTAAMTKADLSKAIIADCACARQVAYRHIQQAEKKGKIKWNPKAEHFNPK